MCAYVFVCMRLCLLKHTCVYVCACAVCTWVCLYVCTCMHVYLLQHMCVHTIFVCAPMCTCVCVLLGGLGGAGDWPMVEKEEDSQDT